ncbi:MAG: hypothetical protein KDC38_05785 [Planctomycetes bacterium]|nr:hypothetical protein [Planctomycetota bacterium]
MNSAAAGPTRVPSAFTPWGERFATAPAVAVAVALPALAIAWHPLANNDLPLHLAIGEWIGTHGIPSVDPFSFLAEGRPWVPHEWLAGWLFAQAHRLAGTTGLTGLALGLAAALALTVWDVSRRLGATPTTFALWSLPIWTMVGPRLILRPHWLALVLLFATWSVLLRARQERRWLWALPGIAALWGNVHGSFGLGLIVMIGDLWLGGLGNETWRHESSRTLRGIITGLILMTPLAQAQAVAQGDLLSGFRHALGLVSDPVFQSQIEEWRSPLSSQPENPFRASFAFALSLPVALGTLAGAVFTVRRGKVPLLYALYVIGTLILYAKSQRFIAHFALSAWPLLPALDLRRSVAGATSAIIALFATVLFMTAGLPVGRDAEAGTWSWRRPGTGWARRHLGFDVIDPLAQSGYTGGVLCEYHYGGAIIWRGEGRLRPTMDSRNSVYGAELYQQHQEALEVENWVPLIPQIEEDPRQRAQLDRLRSAKALLDDLLERVGAVVIRDPEVDPRRMGLHRRLASDPEWEVIGGIRGGALLYRKRAPAGG